MAPILGIWASSKATTAADTGAMFPLQVITVGPTSVSNVEFTNIPNTYTHLQVRLLARSTYAGSGDGYKVTFNGVTGTSYAYHLLIGNGSSASAAANSSVGFMITGDLPAATETANIFGTSIIDILDYANTNKNTTLRALTGDDRNGSGSIRFASGLFNNTAAITSVKFENLNGGNFAQYSQFALYGIKAAS